MQQLLEEHVRFALRRHGDLRVWERAPYWLVEQLGGAYSNLMSNPALVPAAAGEYLLARLVETPAYLRAGAPLGLMHTTPPFGPGLESQLLLTPLDEDAPVEQQRQHMRDNCYAFARSITFHEIYPGHHTQKVHHKLATANSPMGRIFSSPLFVEGWGLYTEDLMWETGFMQDPNVQIFKLRNALWRSARVVVDTGLHTRNMAFEEAVDLLCDEVKLDRRMAAGEVRRYTTFNNPTYPSAYLLGKEAILDLRKKSGPNWVLTLT